MVASCSAFGCTARFQSGNQRRFHSFPCDIELRKKWIVAMRRLNWNPSAAARVCSDHFSLDSYDLTKPWLRHRLKPNAVPTLFHFPQHLQPKIVKKRSHRLTENQPIGSSSLVQESELPLPDSDADTTTAPVSLIPIRLDHSYGQQHHRRKSNIPAVQNTVISKQRRRIKVLSERNRRLCKRNVKLNSCLDELKKKQLVSTDSFELVLKSLPSNAAAIIERCQKGVKTREKFGAQLRTFALTLNFYSPKAYEYVRSTFGNALPSASTLKRWYQCVDGNPGITTESLSALRVKVTEAEADGKQVICALMMDEMAIRKKVEWSGEKYHGFVDFGTNMDDDSLPEAKEALVFLLVAVNSRWKIPVAYYLVAGLSGSERASIVISILEAVHETGVHIVSLTFDGAHSNIAMANQLGANLHFPDMKNWFQHPSTGRKVFIICDPCHMLKLVRNTLGDKKSLCDANGGIVQWLFIERLHNLQVKEGLHAANKLRKAHIEWHQMKMKVKLAAQTLSASVADALEFCNHDLQLEEFRGCEATVQFIRLIDRLFDLMNSRNLLAKGYKAPLTTANISDQRVFVSLAESYLASLRDRNNGVRLLDTNRKTGFLGLIVSARSMIGLYDEMVVLQSVERPFLLTYKVSQDHLELLFSVIRSKGGYNNNPTARQFKAAYKRILVHHEIHNVGTGNCLALDFTMILHTSGLRNGRQIILDVTESRRSNTDTPLLALEESAEKNDEAVFTVPDPLSLSPFVDDVVVYIAGFVCFKLRKTAKCFKCALALTFDYVAPESALLHMKSFGGLSQPPDDVVFLCKQSERCLRAVQSNENILQRKTVLQYLMCKVLTDVAGKDLFNCLNDHALDQSPEENHIVLLTKAVVSQYLTIRLHHIATLHNENRAGKRVRHKLTKLILFNHE